MKEKEKEKEKKPSKKNKNNIQAWWKPKFIGLGFLGLLVILALGVLFFNLNYSKKIFPGTLVGGVDLTGKTEAQAEQAIKDALETKKDQKLMFVLGDKKTEVTRELIQIKYDSAASAKLAWKVGREGRFGKVFTEQIKSILGLNNTNNAVFSYENSNVEKVFSDFSASLPDPLKETTVIMNNMEPTIQIGKEGEAINEDEAMKKVMIFFGQVENSREETLTIVRSTPRVTQESAQVALEQTKLILGNKLTLSANDKQFILEPSQFVNWMEFVPSKNFWTRSWSLTTQINDEAASKYIEELAKQIDQEAKNAKFSINDGKVSAFELSQDGQKLDQAKSKDLIKKAILELTDLSELPVEVAKPTVSSDTIGSKDFKEMIGEGTTSWRGSPANRVHNLTLGSEKISGSVVMPGEEFSTVKAISPITAEAGFRPELVIKNGNRVEPEIGGGLCQVSTTLFRVVLNTGLEVTERDNHSFRVSYYEPPVGMDATIYDPKPDFRFKNNMKTPILIWAIPTTNGLTFQMFGTKDGRKVEVSQPVLFNYVSPGSPIYTVKESMGPEDIRQVERATRGVTASFTYKVTSATGEVLEDDKFVSKYVPVPDTYFVGPGYPIPAPPAE